MKFNQWLKLDHQWKDEGKSIKIGKHSCMLYWDKEKRHYRVELEGHGNVGRSQLSAKEAIKDAEGTLKESPKIGVIFGQGPDIRSTPKTGFSKDYLSSRERNLTHKNSSGFANTIANYFDPLDPKHKKTFRKPNLSISHVVTARKKGKI